MSVQLNLNSTCSTTLSEARRTFLESLADAGESERNVAAHGLGVDRFAEYLQPRPPEDARLADIQSFLSYLSELGVTAESLKTYRTVVERWVSYLEGRRASEDFDEKVAVSPSLDPTPAQTESGPPDERAPSPSVAAFQEPRADDDGNFSTLLLSGFRPAVSPETAAKLGVEPSVPVCEPEPTTPMMDAVPPPFVDVEDIDAGFASVSREPPVSQPGFEAIASEQPVTEAAFKAIEAPSPDASDEPLDPEPVSSHAGFEPVEANSPLLETEFEGLAPEPPAPDASLEPLGPEPPTPDATFEPLDPEPPTPDATFEPIDPEPPTPDATFEPLDPEPPTPDATFEPLDPEPPTPFFESQSFDVPAPEAAGLDTPLPDAVFGAAEAAVAVPAFGETSGSYAQESAASEEPMLADENAEAEERDRARLQAPALPSLEKSPVAAMPGETEFAGPSSSIPLAGGRGGPSAGESTQRGPSGGASRAPVLDPTGGEMLTQPGTGKWGLRRAQGVRSDLSLEAVITMAVSGELGPADLVCKPSGEWVPAKELRPLRRALGLEGSKDEAMTQVRDDIALGRAAAGMIVAGLVSGLVWWVLTLAVGVELVPLAILGGLLGGVGARAAARRPAFKVGLVGAAAAPMSVLVGRYLVFETLSSGIALDGLQDVGGFGSFIGTSLGITQLVCLGLGCLAGFLMGSVGGR